LEYDLVLEGRAAMPGGVQELQIGVVGGKIAAIRRQGLRAGRRISARSCIVFPGFIDTHVHLREPGWEHKEDFATGTAAAAHGGVTTVFDMPNNPRPAVDAATIDEKARLSRAKAIVDVKLFGGVGPRLEEIQAIRDRVIGFKIYLAETTGNLLLPETKLKDALVAVAEANRPASVHCERQAILDSVRKRLAGQRRADLLADLRPPEAEVESVRAVLNARRRARVNVCHVSCAGALDLLRNAKNRGPGVACEATLHHIYFSRKDMLKNGLLTMNPPLRSEQDRRAVLEGLRSGSVDFLVTDHAPHTLTEKVKDGARGIPGLDNYGNVVAWLIKEQGFSPETIACVTAGNQARFFGLRDRGVIALGRRADFALLDLRAPERVGSGSVRSKCGWSPYEGREFPGRVRWTVFGGKVLLDDFEPAT
jgi:dihydroorotase